MRDSTRAWLGSLSPWAAGGALIYLLLTWPAVRSPGAVLLHHLPAVATSLLHDWVLKSVARSPTHGLWGTILLGHTLLWGAGVGLGVRALVGGRRERWPRPWLQAVLLGTLVTWLPLAVRSDLLSSCHSLAGARALSPCDYTRSEHWQICRSGCPYRSRLNEVLLLPAAAAWSLGGPLGGPLLIVLEGPLLGLLGLAAWRAWRRRRGRWIPPSIKGVR